MDSGPWLAVKQVNATRSLSLLDHIPKNIPKEPAQESAKLHQGPLGPVMATGSLRQGSATKLYLEIKSTRSHGLERKKLYYLALVWDLGLRGSLLDHNCPAPSKGQCLPEEGGRTSNELGKSSASSREKENRLP